MPELLTVFTPTYNRALTLERCYQSLLSQNDRRFKWLVVDDGSDDGTEGLMSEIMSSDCPFPVQYIKKAHGGLHTAYNLALEASGTELFMCLDSDDFLTDGAVNAILSFWQKNKNSSAGGFAALNKKMNGEIIGGGFPDIKECSLMELRFKYRHRGDIKMIYRTELLRSAAPIPEYSGEEILNPFYLFLKADKKAPLLLMNSAVCVVDYSTNGLHTRVLYDYIHSPKSYQELRRMMMTAKNAPLSYKFRGCIHYVSSSLFAHDKNFLKASPCRVLTFLALPFGLALNILVRILQFFREKRCES